MMLLYAPDAKGYIGFHASDIKARCPICGRLYPFDVASYLLNGGTLDGGPADDPWCPSCIIKRDLGRSKE